MANAAEHRWFSPTSDIRLVAKWLVSPEGIRVTRRAVAFFLGWAVATVLLFVLVSSLHLSTDNGKEDQLPDSGVALFVVMLILNFIGLSAVLTCITLKARLIRTDQRLAAQHTAYYRARLEGEFAQKEMLFLAEKARWEREQDEWKAKMQNEIYELILGQVDRGTLGPRSKSQDGGTYDFPDRS